MEGDGIRALGPADPAWTHGVPLQRVVPVGAAPSLDGPHESAPRLCSHGADLMLVFRVLD